MIATNIVSVIMHLPESAVTTKILVDALPWLKHEARIEAAEWFGMDPAAIEQHWIEKYLLMRKEYDAIEISKIYTEVRKCRMS